MIFKKPKNTLEGHLKLAIFESVEEIFIPCSKCKKNLPQSKLSDTLNVCPYCRHHFKMNARQRINLICDENSFEETDKTLHSKNIINFPEYDKKLKNATLESGECDGVVCGTCKINNIKCAIFSMESSFMMGSMGSVVGEKITRLFELATADSLPVIGYCVSGGARMQEGIISLMQMAKTSGALKLHSDAKNLFVSVLTDPTTGGVSASFAMAADIIIAEPGALICFAGPRVIEQTIRKKLPEGFQRAEFLLEKGFLDDVIDRKRQRKYLMHIISMHNYNKSQNSKKENSEPNRNQDRL